MLNVNALETEGRNIEITRTAVKETSVSQVSEVAEEKEASISSIVSERPPRYDSVEISKEGYEQLENQIKASQDGSGEDSSSNKANGLGAAKGGAPKAQSTEESTISSLTDEDDDTTDLSSLTEDELQELLAEGKITKQQVDNELARRNGSNAESIEE